MHSRDPSAGRRTGGHGRGQSPIICEITLRWYLQAAILAAPCGSAMAAPWFSLISKYEFYRFRGEVSVERSDINEFSTLAALMAVPEVYDQRQ